MKTSDLDFQYPEELVATDPGEKSRVMFCNAGNAPRELSLSELKLQFQKNDIVILNDTRVVKKRIFADDGLEILFLDETEPGVWTVLMPSKKLKPGQQVNLPGDVQVTLLEKGLPQKVSVRPKIGFEYFGKHGHMALPPYIQKARGERQSRQDDEAWYQTAWAKQQGSSAAPTASLHFNNDYWIDLNSRGVAVATLTLHVGLGTFLPVHAEDLNEHKMHSEWVEISKGTLNQIARAKATGGRVWALGTTVMRALESWPRGYFQEDEDRLFGNTDIFIKPGFEFEVVDVLMTNFHQPKSTLMALVAAFAGLETTLHNYQWAIENRFRLFSYGDLSVWTRK